MKKTNIVLGTILVSALTLAIGCSNAVTDEHFNDKTIELGTPNAKAIAYPGVNYVYWDGVKNAKDGYVVEYYENGVYKSSKKFTTTSFTDSDVKYDVKKGYRISATGDDRARSVVFTSGNSSWVEVNPIVPPRATKPLDLAKYERGYQEGREYTLSDDDAKFQLKAENVVPVIKDNKIIIDFPAKAYLTYTLSYKVKGSNAKSLNGKDDWTTLTPSYSDYAVNNKTGTFRHTISSAGTYNHKIKVTSFVNNDFEEIELSSEVIVPGLGVASATTDVSAKYVDGKARVAFVPANLKDGSLAPTSMYKIYKAEKGTAEYKAVEAEINNFFVVNNTYFVDDEIENTAKAYNYLIVLTDGTKYADNAAEAELKAFNNANITDATAATLNSPAYITDKKVRITFIPANLADGTLAEPKLYKVYRKVQGAEDTTFTAVSSATVNASNASNNLYYVDDVITNNKVAYVYKLVLTDGTFAKACGNKTLAAYNEKTTAPTLAIALSNLDNDKNGLVNDAKITLTLNNKDQTIVSAKYIESEKADINDSDVFASGKDITKAFNCVAGDGKTFIAELLNVEDKNYIHVVAVVGEEGKASYVITKTSSSKVDLTKSAATAATSISFSAVAKQTDKALNDYTLSFNLSDKTTLKSVSLGYGDTINEAKVKALANEVPVKVTTTDLRTSYKFELDNLTLNQYVVAAITVEEENKEPTTTFSAASFVKYADVTPLSASVTNTTPTPVPEDTITKNPGTPDEYAYIVNKKIFTVTVSDVIDLTSDDWSNYTVQAFFSVGKDSNGTSEWTPIEIKETDASKNQVNPTSRDYEGTGGFTKTWYTGSKTKDATYSTASYSDKVKIKLVKILKADPSKKAESITEKNITYTINN